jgi:cytochrome P450
MAYLDDYDRIPADHPQERVALMGRLIRTDPHGLFSELRASRPIFRTPGFTLVTRFKDVQEVLSRNEVFTVKLYASRMDPVVNGPFMLARDNTAANWREKSIMKAMLRPEDLPLVRALAGRFAEESLDGCATDGKIEVVSRLGREVPVRICGDYFGFPGPDMSTMYRWSKATQSDMFKNLANDPNIHAASVQAGQEMRPYLIELLAQKRLVDGSTHAEDVFSRLVRTEFPEELGFDDTRVVANMAGLLIGAVETISQAIAQVLDQLLHRPDVLGAAQAAAGSGDDASFDGFVWEALRFNPINPLVFRLCESDYAVATGMPRQATITAGTIVFACTASAMFDGDDVPDPETFQPRRASYQFMHFGYGDHTCLGKYVGMMVIPEVVKRVLLRPNVRLIPGGEGKLDFQGGFFPERFMIAYDSAIKPAPVHGGSSDG